MAAPILLLGLLALGQKGVGDDVAVPELGISIPKSAGNIAFTKRTDFDEKELGFSLAYSNRMCLVSVIVYDLGKKGIPDGPKSKLVAEQLEASIRDLMAGQKKGPITNVAPMAGDVPLPKEVRDKFLTAGFTYDIPGGPAKGYVLLTARGNHFLKVRISQYIVDGRANDDELNQFLTALAKRLK